MGSAFQQLLSRNHSRMLFDRYEKVFDDSIQDFSVNASLSKKWHFTNLKGAKVEDRFAERAYDSSFLSDPRTANVLRFSTRPRERNKRTNGKYRTPQWSCCDAGATGTSPFSVSIQIVGLGLEGDSSTAAPAKEVPSTLRAPIDICDRYAEEAESVVRGAAVHHVKSVPGGSREDRATSSSPPIPIEATFEPSYAPKLQVSGTTESERCLQRGNDDAQLGAPAQRSASAATGTEYDVASALRPEGVDVLQSFENASSQVEDPLLSNAANNGALEVFNGEVQPHKGLLQQMREIILFAGPALGIWLSGPIMSLIDTAVVGNSSSIELAALGPGTVFCDQFGYVFMFLSVATSNLIATAIAKQDEIEVAHHLSRLLFVALACGIGMLILTGAFSALLLQAFTGPQNAGLLPAANSYVQIRSLAWPVNLVGLVALSASLGMQDSWTPLKVLAVASFVNLSGDILLCTYLGYGIAGAAWATMVSQYVGGYLMLRSLEKKGYNPLALCIPSARELLQMIELAAPVLLTMLSKVSFYAFITFLSSSLGAVVLAAHQVMIGIYSTCTVSGEPLSQTALSFMPALIQGANRDFRKAKTLLRSLMLIGALAGVSLGLFAISFPWVFPQVFTNDKAIISQMRAITVPFLCALVITPPLLSLEGTLLAGRDLTFLSVSMVSCFIGGSVLLKVFKELGFGLQGFWWILACFQSARFVMAFARLRSAKSVLRDSIPVTEQGLPHFKVA